MKKIIINLIIIFLFVNVNSQIIDDFPYLCEFEEYSDCKWFNVEGRDDCDWLYSLDKNRYAFVKSLNEVEEKQAWLEAIVDLRYVEKAKLVFDYKMLSSISISSTSNIKNIKPGTLQVDINHNGEWKYGIWYTHSNDIKWKKQKIDLSEYCGELIIVSFTGYIKTPKTDICLDNILITGK